MGCDGPNAACVGFALVAPALMMLVVHVGSYLVARRLPRADLVHLGPFMFAIFLAGVLVGSASQMENMHGLLGIPPTAVQRLAFWGPLALHLVSAPLYLRVANRLRRRLPAPAEATP